ncbi:MAG: hypothetical protein HOP15_13575, partial [Planctomycetes bacterium]|nr:hypothetical protein [Planctomycetota bacterium]
MQQLLARSAIGIAVFAGALAPFVLSSRSAPPPPQGGSAIQQQSVDSLFTMKVTTPTPVQDVLPILFQRGVQLDGSLRAAPQQPPMVVAANPFEDAWRAPSIGGIDLVTGAFELQEVDIALPASVPWVVGRSNNARQESSGTHRTSNSYQGRNWFQTSQPEIAFYDDATNSKDMVFLFYGADRFSEYKRVDSTGPTFRGVNGASGVFKHVAGDPDTYTLTDQHGNELVFIGFDTEAYGAAGQLWKITDPAGNVAYVGDSASPSAAIDQAGGYTKGYDSSGRMKKAYDSADRRFSYTYTTLDSVVRLTQVKAETKTGGTWASPSGVATVMTV